jgi:esterase/lipase superfamily enzyme
MERHYDSFQSRIMERPAEYLWFGNAGRPLLMFPTSGGRFHEAEDRNLVSTMADYVNEGRLQICCIDSWNDETWNNTRVHPAERVRLGDRYDHYLAEEMLPMVAARAGRGDIALFGASQGGFHAVNTACRHPEQVARCIALSGLMDNTRLLDGHWDELCYFHNPMASVPNMNEEWVGKLRTVEWFLATGETDSLVQETRNFSDILRRKGIPVHSEIWPGVFGHDWPYWKEHLRRFVI